MGDVKPDGEIKKIFLTKPMGTVNEPTSSLAQSRPPRLCTVRVPPRRYVPPVEKSEEYLTNQKRHRYWNSWEELYIVELWRRFKDEVTIINVPLPVYRKMMIAMRNRNMIVTAQDCRRKINRLNTRYKQELKRLETTGCKSEWRLFPLIHCVMVPKIKEFDPWHENKIIKKLLDKIPKPVEVKTIAPTINNDNQQTQQIQQLQTPTNIITIQPRPPPITNNLTPLSTAILTDSSCPYKLRSTRGSFDKPSILPFRNITLEKIEQLREDNKRLAVQRDEDLKSLHMEEENSKCFETFIRIWTEKKELEMRRIQRMSEECGIKIENEENHNADHQLQETVAAK